LPIYAEARDNLLSNWKTKLIHSQANVPQGFRSLVTPVFRGSTTLFERAADAVDHWDHDESPYSYGLYGTPTALELAARIAELEHGKKTFLTPGGQSAISLINLALLKAGDHVLLPESVYGPNANFAAEMLGKFGVDVQTYTPTVGEGISADLRANTRLIWCESPGSVTMEVQDVRAIAEVAHRAGALVVLDNTYSAGVYFDAFAHGVDVSMQALTKYIGGHSDLLLGSVTTNDHAVYKSLGAASQQLGLTVSPDDCALALRGMQTLAVRLAAIQSAAIRIAKWIAARPEVEIVLHPALPSCPGHDLWLRDFTGSTGVFSFVLKKRYRRQDVVDFIDRLRLFPVGYSWGGVTSLAVPWTAGAHRPNWAYGERLIRLHIGLEEIDDLLADLTRSFEALPAYGPGA